MLDDLMHNLQQLAKSLPSDNYLPETPTVYLRRQESGMLTLSQPNIVSDSPVLRRTPEDLRIVTTPDVGLTDTETDVLLPPVKQQSGEANQNDAKEKNPGFWRRFLPLKQPGLRDKPGPTNKQPPTSTIQCIKSGVLRIWPFHKRELKKEKNSRHSVAEPLPWWRRGRRRK
jgi:hypothetical protein